MSKPRNKKSGSKKMLQMVKTPKIVPVSHVVTEHTHDESCDHEHHVEQPAAKPLPTVEELAAILKKIQEARNKAKTERKAKLKTKGSLTQERHLRPRMARRRAVRALRTAEMQQRKQEQAEAEITGTIAPENTKVRWHLDPRRESQR